LTYSKDDIFNKLSIGHKSEVKLTMSEELVKQFGILSGDSNPLHTNEDYAKSKGFSGKVCYGNILGMLISKLVGMGLGSDEVMLVSEKIDFKQPIYIGDIVELRSEVSSKSEAVRIIELELSFWKAMGVKVASGKCQVRFF
jgi:3-hydroxybutyryl-CoA dehydratase